MKDYLISMFIDDELNLDDKISFVEAVHADKVFKYNTIDFVHQEKLIRSEVVDQVPSIKIREKKILGHSFWRPIGIFASGLAAALIIFFFALPSQEKLSVPYRFVIYQPEVNKVEITGSFIGWKSLPMKKLGAGGYWGITLHLHEGEHRFSYIVEGNQRLTDPTILTRERDDFGGENSILKVNLQT